LPFLPRFNQAVIFSENNSRWEVEFEDKAFAKFGGNGHYVVIIDLRTKGYPLILEDEIDQTEEDFTDQPPVIPKVEAMSTPNGDFYHIRINGKIYKFSKVKYRILGNRSNFKIRKFRP